MLEPEIPLNANANFRLDSLETPFPTVWTLMNVPFLISTPVVAASIQMVLMQTWLWTSHQDFQCILENQLDCLRSLYDEIELIISNYKFDL